ncbi:uncharacterized protein UMAG_11505 [Mycosarcoma maydis]|uniref:Uncharacterized protein n=1 Tax=Mycosarcoma maydis TaxID=5270 RepID=A0A0D1CPK2_MYCMD|nr:uncharacterized protein UMAG_11505 [Ustilago maydis 521]KIS68518.1 hypothetical protein UMAG_11505 [Ustilago maydis 521]|eukprot:XP_011390108.1 hypothetical protein UMAG_11505 [Ustilago maydis 521]
MGGSDIKHDSTTRSGTEALSTSVSDTQRQTETDMSKVHVSDLAQRLLPQASGIGEYAMFDRDAVAVHASPRSFAKDFEREQVRALLDVFTSATAPSVSTELLKQHAKSITLATTDYTLSGPRGAQHPLEIITLHPSHAHAQVLFAAPTATLLLVFKTAPDTDASYQSNEKQGVWTAVRSFASALSQIGL